MEERKNEMQDMERDVELEVETEKEGEQESKGEKFIRLAQGRVTRARQAIAIIGHLSNTSAYEYTTEQVEQMFSVLETELAQVKAGFTKVEKEEKKFSFQ